MKSMRKIFTLAKLGLFKIGTGKDKDGVCGLGCALRLP